MALVVVHDLTPLTQLNLEEDAEAEYGDSHNDGEPVKHPQTLSQLHPLLQVELHRHEWHCVVSGRSH